MLKWINILHLHQPPHQDEVILKKITSESYSLIISLLERYPNLKLTINISGSLIELLGQYGLEQILERIHQFAKEGRVELMGTAMHHPILPLIPEQEVNRQIDLYLALFEKTFPGIAKPKGFFLPEMAYSKKVATLIAQKGFSWIVLDDLHKGLPADSTIQYQVKDLPITVLFRNRKVSSHFPPEAIFKFLHFIDQDINLVTAHDGELYGHWHTDDKGYYDKAFNNPQIQFFLASEFIESLTKKEEVEVKEISWETTLEDEAAGAPYSLWQHPTNEIQTHMWKFADFCLKILEEHRLDPYFLKARHRIDRGLTSCAWWWMSGRKIGPLSPISWHPSETKKGIDELIEGLRYLSLSPEIEALAEKQYQVLIKLIFDTHAKLTEESQ